MDFTVDKRIEEKKKFKNIKKENRQNFRELFKKTYVGKGVESIVYKGEYNNFNTTIKIVDLKKLRKGKIKLLDYTYDYYLQIKDTKQIFKEHPSLIEIISYKLINELIIQKICPNYSFNYYIGFLENRRQMIDKIYFYNEYINFGDLEIFLKNKKYSNQILLNILFQIMISIIGIQKYFNMIHTDLHLNNILVQQITPGGYWIYKLNNVKYYLPNLGFVILMHDFGFSLIPQKLYVNWHHKNIKNEFCQHNKYSLYLYYFQTVCYNQI